MGMSPIYLWKSVIETIKAYALSCMLATGILYVVSGLVNYIIFYYIGGILFLMPVFALVVKKWIPEKRISPDGKAVFISGCDTGFGHLLARRLDELGFQVFAGCLFPDGDGAADLRNLRSNRLHVIGLDVTSDISVQEAANYVKENLKDNILWAVVNNAGINSPSEILWTSMETLQRLIDVNTFGVIRVSKAFLPKLSESKGRIITVTSLGGRCVLPGMVPYCISKQAAIGFSDGLRLEMSRRDVQVITIEPSYYRTPLIEEKNIEDGIRKSWRGAPKYEKDMYSSNYIDNFIKRAIDLSRNYSRHPREVISAIENVIMSSCPECSYIIGGSSSRLINWLKPKLPEPIFTFLIFCLVSTDIW